jgi:hypothetical protein
MDLLQDLLLDRLLDLLLGLLVAFVWDCSKSQCFPMFLLSGKRGVQKP